jgi:hypothetical protein
MCVWALVSTYLCIYVCMYLQGGDDIYVEGGVYIYVMLVCCKWREMLVGKVRQMHRFVDVYVEYSRGCEATRYAVTRASR